MQNPISAEQLAEKLEDKDFLLFNVYILPTVMISKTDHHFPFHRTLQNLDLFPNDKSKEIVVYCRNGHLSRFVQSKLTKLGYLNVFQLEGGYAAWINAGLPQEINS